MTGARVTRNCRPVPVTWYPPWEGRRHCVGSWNTHWAGGRIWSHLSWGPGDKLWDGVAVLACIRLLTDGIVVSPLRTLAALGWRRKNGTCLHVVVHHLLLEREGKGKERRRWRERGASREYSVGLKSPISYIEFHPVFNLLSWSRVLPANHQLRAIMVLRSWESPVLIF